MALSEQIVLSRLGMLPSGLIGSKESDLGFRIVPWHASHAGTGLRVLFRNEEAEMRRKLVEADRVECVLGLGPGLFYNSPMEACVIVCRSRKEAARQGCILFIDAVAEIARERGQSFLRPEHQARILSSYRAFADEPGFAAVVSTSDVLTAEGNLSIARYVKKPKPQVPCGEAVTLAGARNDFDAQGRDFWTGMDALLDVLDGLAQAENADA